MNPLSSKLTGKGFINLRTNKKYALNIESVKDFLKS